MGRSRLAMVIDPEPASRAEVEGMLTTMPVALVADAGYGVEAISLAEETQPEVILVAVAEPADRALQTIRAITEILPDCQIIVYSDMTDVSVMRQVMQIGVRDYLPLPLTQIELLAAIDRTSTEDAGDGATVDLASRAAGVVLTIFGAKGGIGKSTIATNISAAVASDTELSVLLIDMDTRFGDIAIMMDVEPRYTISDVAASMDTMDRETFRSALTEHESGVSILAAPKHPAEWRNITAEQMKTLIEYSARMFDYVILDTPGTFNDIVATAIEVANRVLVVSSLDMASIKDTAYMLDLLEAEGFPPSRLLLTINRVNRAHSIKVSDIRNVVHQEVFWDIPYDDQILQANQVGSPVVISKPKSKAAKQFRELSEKITGHRPNSARSSNGHGGFLRFLLPSALFRRNAASA